VRADQADLIYKSEEAKFDSVVEDLLTRNESGQPVLVGTASVDRSEHLGRLLEKRGIPHEVLNAKQHFREAEIVAQAGRLGMVTVATNMAGRGVDILLGGNPEGLARRDVLGEGLELESPEGEARMAELLQQYKEQCRAEGDKVRELGGLYVLGTERHESRRIDNQLRGRSGRQGDPGESRFYLSLDDELMRIFATGALSWVMGKALPDDIPIEARMVTKAIERAQNTVEQRNAEIRKNVLKYDEVMNEQRKVIYKRRDQILEGTDLRDQTMEAVAEAVEGLITSHCNADHPEDWDLDGLIADAGAYWPLGLALEDLRNPTTSDELYELLVSDATAHYEKREQEVTPEIMRQVERQVMLRIIDQRWREHLYAMDYLREGIHLRAMGQKDPAVEWQREGFEMFGLMMAGIDDDFVKYVMHVQVAVQPPEQPQPEQIRDVTYSAADDPVQGGRSIAAAAKAVAASQGTAAPETAPAADEEPELQQPTVKSEWDKTPRNAPCPCGSGKKFKLCHGR
jgi:preprotein translocase subunit SecA